MQQNHKLFTAIEYIESYAAGDRDYLIIRNCTNPNCENPERIMIDGKSFLLLSKHFYEDAIKADKRQSRCNHCHFVHKRAMREAETAKQERISLWDIMTDEERHEAMSDYLRKKAAEDQS